MMEASEAQEKKTTGRSRVNLIKVPFGLGAGRPGEEQGPDSITKAGIGRMIRNLGRELSEEQVTGMWLREASSERSSAVKNLRAVLEMSLLVARRVQQAAEEGAFPLVLGGDRSVSIGAAAGLAERYANPGLIWFDAHAGLLTEETGPTGSANEMALSAILGRMPWKIPGLGHIRKEKVVLIGTREVYPQEREWILGQGITCFTMHEIDRMGIQRVIEEARKIAGAGTDGLHVSFAADTLDPLEAPGVGSPVPGGLFYREAHFALELLAEGGEVTSMDVTGVNPLLDDQRRTGRLLSGLAASLLGKRIL
ncbi:MULTISPECIES: arginase [Paenibacillus]|uniref:arginase n=1 Tax=Paenibacillus TaxID=44249 RepID=UPI0022B90BE8|nr:arginase [Paenibacillus caseinilyticus]MCZ8518460.1 arginase [Paenibacillus caseinilyticus]